MDTQTDRWTHGQADGHRQVDGHTNRQIETRTKFLVPYQRTYKDHPDTRYITAEIGTYIAGYYTVTTGVATNKPITKCCMSMRSGYNGQKDSVVSDTYPNELRSQITLQSQ